MKPGHFGLLAALLASGALGAALLWGGCMAAGGAMLRGAKSARGPAASRQAHTRQVPTRPVSSESTPEERAGFRKFRFSYDAPGGEPRPRNVFLWYPTSDEPVRYDYRGQIGLAAEKGKIAAGPHPLIVFSHGFLGTGDQAIFLLEALARAGYIVAAINHADAAGERSTAPAWPDFVDSRKWSDSTYRDRRDDLAALIDFLLKRNSDAGSSIHARIDESKIGAAGHSLGGYTVLGTAGGWPSWRDERIQAALLLSPYSLPYIDRGALDEIKIPVMLQGGTLDLGITPFLPPVYDQVAGPKYFLVLNDETHFAWTNLMSAGKTTTEAAGSGNARRIVDYSIAFFDRHLRRCEASESVLERSGGLSSYRCLVPAEESESDEP